MARVELDARAERAAVMAALQSPEGQAIVVADAQNYASGGITLVHCDLTG